MKAKELLTNLGRSVCAYVSCYYFGGVYENEEDFVKSVWGKQASILVNRRLYSEEVLVLNREIHLSNMGDYKADVVINTNDDRDYNLLFVYNIDD